MTKPDRRLNVFLLLICLCTACVACSAGKPLSPAEKTVRDNTYYFDKGRSYYLKGCYPKALSYFETAHELFTLSDDTLGIAHSLNGIANVYYRVNDIDSALLLYDDAIAAYRQAADGQGLIRSMSNKAAALIAAGRTEEAAIILDQADARADAGKVLIALRMKTRALLLMKRGDTQGATRLLDDALKAVDKSDAETTADILFALGRLAEAGQPDQACSFFNQALELDQAAGAYAQIAKDLKALGLCHSASGSEEQAVEYFKRSIKIFAILNDTGQVAEVSVLLEDSARETGTDIQAVMHYAQQWRNGDTESRICK